MKKTIEILENYETPDFLDLDEIYGFSQLCSSGTAYKGCKTPCNAGI